MVTKFVLGKRKILNVSRKQADEPFEEHLRGFI